MGAGALATVLEGREPQAAAKAAPGRDFAFLAAAAVAGRAEIEAAQMALKKATRPEVKAYAQMIVEDHGKANRELEDLASQEGLVLPREAGEAARATRERLGALSGARFDEAYVEAMVEAHEDAVLLFTREIDSGTDSLARAWAKKTLLTLESHEAKAKDLATTGGALSGR
jgi:putative membrane protein